MKHRKHTLSQRVADSNRRARFAVKPLALAVALAAGGQSLLMPNTLRAEQIITDGRTNTTLEIQGNVTDVRTKTIVGSTAYNSFSKFDVNKGKVVNLHVPSKADNLLNLVHSANPSHINGVLNSIKDGGIGGNVYIANTAGVVIGAEGEVNVGALTIVTPTREVMDGFFGADGTPSSAATQAILDHSVAISPGGNVTVKGKINAKGNITIAAGNVSNSGAIQSGAVFVSEEPDFSDVVNVADLQTGTRISIENGDIEILAEEDIVNTGIIASEGANSLKGGDIHLQTGRDISVAGSAKITTSGHGENSAGGNVIIKAERNATLQDDAKIAASAGETGDGGFVEFSAKDTVTITGGSLRASAKAGASGTVLIDPATISWIGSGYDQFTDGTNFVLEADDSIVLDNVVISTRQTAGADTRSASASQPTRLFQFATACCLAALTVSTRGRAGRGLAPSSTPCPPCLISTMCLTAKRRPALPLTALMALSVCRGR